jgi:hypothetical protein
MAALNFPTSPSTNQIFTENGKTWKYDGTAWRTLNVASLVNGGTGLTNITSGNSFLSSNSAGTALTYRNFVAGTGISFSISASSVTFSSVNSGFVSGSGTSAFVPLWTSEGTGLTNSVMSQTGDIIIVNGSIKALTKSFKIPHPLDPENKYLEHGSLEGPEHGIYQRGRASGYDKVDVSLPDYFHALSESDISVILTPRVPCSLYVSESSSFSFSVKRINKKFYRKEYIEFDYIVVGERKDIKLIVEQTR